MTIETLPAEEVHGGLRIVRITNARGQFESKIWMGKAKRPEWVLFRKLESREAHITSRKAGWDSAQAFKQERAAARKAFDATEVFPVGTILVSSWGYDQTNVDFYEVLAVTRQMVTIEKIGQKRTKTLTDMSEHVTANPAHRTGKITRHRATSANLRLETYAYASVWNGTPKYQSHYA